MGAQVGSGFQGAGRLLCCAAVLLTCTANLMAQPRKPMGGGGADDHWMPARTWVFAVGILEFEGNRFGGFPKEGRRDDILMETFRKRGVPEEQIKFIKDSEATTANVHREFMDFLPRAGQGDWLIVYYTGHGYHSPDHQTAYLASYDTSDTTPSLEVAVIPRLIERHFQGARAMIAIDCCCSGMIVENLERMEEARKGTDRPMRVSYAAFASSHENSGSTANWTFTENLIYAFNGENFMDDDSDGVVTIRELAANIHQDMTFAERQMPKHAVFGRRMPEQLAIVRVKEPADPDVGVRGEFRSYDDQWYPGFTIAKDGTKRKVRYYGYDSSEDEWVDADRIRVPQVPQTRPVGARVQAMSYGEWYPGKVIRVTQGLHLIKFDGYDESWNEWHPITGIR
jgi:hypothetical protein